MPFRRNRGKMSRHRRNNPGKIALAKVNKIEKQREKKLIDNDGSPASSNTVTITPISLIAQGDTANDREGSKVVLTSLQMKYSWKQNTNAVASRCRVMLVLDKQVNGATFSAGDLLQSTALGTGIVSPLNLDGAFRFKILYNKVHTLSSEGSVVQYGEMFRKINIPARYTGVPGNIANVLSSGLFLVHLSDETTQTPTISFFTRIRFIDS